MNGKLGIIGQGAWGRALTATQTRAGRTVAIHSREEPDIAALSPCDVILVTTPAQALRGYMTEIAGDLPRDATYIVCSKGIELATGKLLTEVMADTLGADTKVAILSGPNQAGEVLSGLPAATTIAARTGAFELAARIGTPHFRVYSTDDVIGAQMGGAVKNVIAIACGIAMGAGLGENARAAIMTRGFAEMVRIAVALGGRAETLMGMCGFGDLVLSASSLTLRNYAIGYKIGQAGLAAPVLAASTSLTEGVATARAVSDLALARGISTPTTDAVVDVLYGNEPVKQVIAQLLAREQKQEV